jgi:HEXXH motif-containing protein
VTSFKLTALHVPSQEILEYGPWEADPDPLKASVQASFAHGFICGFHSRATAGEGPPEDLAEFTIVEVPAEPPTNVVGVLRAEASATVTHADGTTS